MNHPPLLPTPCPINPKVREILVHKLIKGKCSSYCTVAHSAHKRSWKVAWLKGVTFFDSKYLKEADCPKPNDASLKITIMRKMRIKYNYCEYIDGKWHECPD